MDNGIFGDYDMKKSPSTKDFVLSYIDDEMARRNLPGRILSAANESLSDKSKRRPAARPTPLQRILSDVTSTTDGDDQELYPTDQAGATGTREQPAAAVRRTSFESGDGEGKVEAAPGRATPLKRRGSAERSVGSPHKPEHIEIAYEPQEGPCGPVSGAERAPMALQVFGEASKVFMEGVECIVDDEFWKCFQSRKPRPWNWNAYLWPLWFGGCVIRYLILFPMRVVVFILGWIAFGLGMLIVQTCMPRGPGRTAWEHSLISMMCGVFCITWGAVIRYHGSPVKTREGECQPVYVANHTSMIDVIILQQMRCFSLVGQRHKGIVRFLQEVVLGCLQCVWFDRGEIKDRTAVARKLKEHANDPTRNPLLVFPEGTCVNNEYVIQFKKGIFEIGAPVVPVAIKYNKMFVDPFWNSRAQSFPMHLVELMTSWCLICEVWYLKPHYRRENESAEDFAGRVKAAIAVKSGLKNVNWDGYMKYWKPSHRYLQSRQAVFAKKLRGIYNDRVAEDDRRANEERKRLAALTDPASLKELSFSFSNSGSSDAGNGLRHRASHHASASR
mmetsp:Transcript_23112/g.65609  ORF Transcript_23112/g.65609 Transcript_23112/m.65609 type:complete len:558 (-) Transcript_23112:289-1962(-)